MNGGSFCGYAVSDWMDLNDVMREVGLKSPKDAANWLLDGAAALKEERAKALMLEAKLERITKILGG